MNTFKLTGPVLLKLLCNNSRPTYQQRLIWKCGASCCLKSVLTGARPLHTCNCACAFNNKHSSSSSSGRRSTRSDDEAHARDAAIDQSKGRSKIVLQNWDRNYAEVRRRKQVKEKYREVQGDKASSEPATAAMGLAEDMEEERPHQAKSVEPSDEFGSLTIGITQVPVNDAYSKMTKEQLSELESSIYSIDQVEDADDSRVVPEDLSERMYFRKLKIKVKALINSGQLSEGLDLFTHTLKAGGIRYDMQDLSHTFTVLIAECGRAGHVKMAMSLFTDMKKRSCFVQPSVYTSLFNAIANSIGDKQKNLESLEKLKRNMLDKGFVPNIIHYHTLIKAYGRLGELQAAFSVVDEMIQKSISDPNGKPRLTTETFNFLLSACITDKQNGFRHSLATWKKMIDMRIAPDHFSFKLFLRSVRECGIVVPKSVRKLLGELSPYAQNEGLVESGSGSMYLVPGTDVEIHDLKVVPPMIHSETGFDDNCSLILNELVNDDDSAITSAKSKQANVDFASGGSELLNLLRSNCTPTRGVQTLLQYPQNRLAILGGLKAVVKEMRNFYIKADLKMVSELVQIIHPIEIPDLMLLITDQKIKLDTDFYNLMIKRYIVWDKQTEARNVLKLMHRSRVHPNLMTWGIFSLACKDWKSGKRLLKDIDLYNMEPNIQIVGGLLGTAVRNFDPRYVLRVMEALNALGLQPDSMFVEKINNFRDTVQKGLVNWEQGLEVTPFALHTQLKDNYENFMNYYAKFKLRYRTWMDSVPEKVLVQVRNPDHVTDPWEEEFKARKKSLKPVAQFN